MKCENNIKNVFSNLKLTLENIMDHWNDLVWSIFEKVQKIGPMLDLGGGKKIPTCCVFMNSSLKHGAKRPKGR